MKINKYFIVTFLFFFLNSFLLPHGLLYTTLLTPLFYIKLLLKKYKFVIVKFLLVASPFVLAHLIVGVELKQYFISFALLFTVYIFIYTVYDFLISRDYLGSFFKKLTNINFILTCIAVLTLLTPFKEFWALHPVSSNIHNLPRLELFTYEPSYYSTLLVPLFFYFLLSFTLAKETNSLVKLMMLTLSLVLSFSLGVISVLVFSVFFVTFINLHKIRVKRKLVLIGLYVLLLLIIFSVLLLIFYPENPLYFRIYNVFTGNDSSGKGRTFEAIEIAYLLLQKGNMYWGIGLGQLNLVGYELITDYYNYDKQLIKTVAIPNAFAETLAFFGFIGAGLRILLQVFLFFRTKVYSNYFQSLCFFYIFIYQFTGSYITNAAEYIIWLFAFIPYFSNFNKQSWNEKIAYESK